MCTVSMHVSFVPAASELHPARGDAQVARNRIWHEHCTKEQNTMQLNTHFAINNPYKSASPHPRLRAPYGGA